jgi:hypothetical protein
MRKVKQSDFLFDDEEFDSIFVGRCESKAKMYEYLKKNDDSLKNGFIGFEMGADFGINTYDEDFCLMKFLNEETNDVEKILEELPVETIERVQEIYSGGFPEAWNTVICLGQIKYEGELKEVDNPDFGKFKFIGSFDSSGICRGGIWADENDKFISKRRYNKYGVYAPDEDEDEDYVDDD